MLNQKEVLTMGSFYGGGGGKFMDMLTITLPALTRGPLTLPSTATNVVKGLLQRLDLHDAP